MSSASGDVAAIGTDVGQGFLYGGPIGGAIGALAAIPTLFQTSITGIEKQDATTVVNAAAPVFNENKTLFLKNPSPASQSQGISNFMSMWETMTAKLITFGKVGTISVNDRSPGGKVDWWALYLDPIQNYKFPPLASPLVDAANVGGSSSSAVSGSAGAVPSALSKAMPYLAIIAIATILLVLYG